MFNFRLAVTGVKQPCTAFSRFFFCENQNWFIDVFDDPPMRFRFVVIWSDSAVFRFCVKFVRYFLVISCCC